MLTRAALVLFAMLLAGCTAPADPGPSNHATLASATAAGSEGLANTTGSLVVFARMPDMSILSAVTVQAGNQTQTTGPDGLARFDKLPGGALNVTARKEAHRTSQLNVTIIAGQETRVEAILAPLGNDQHSHEKGVFAHRDLYRFEGHFDCSATYVIITGDCRILVDNVTSNAGVPNPTANATTARNIVQFPLDATWSRLVVEMNWTAPTLSAEQGMTMALEPAQAPADGHAAKYASVNGSSPLRVDLAPGLKHKTASFNDMPQPQGGEILRARAFVEGLQHNPGGTGFLGAGFAKDQAFTLWVSIFYGEDMPQGYSALPKA